MARNKIKNMRGHEDDSYITAHYLLSYSINSDNRYKSTDELLLYDERMVDGKKVVGGKRIKATMGYEALKVIPVDVDNYIVPEDKENRLDLISLDFYGSSKFWWLIAYENIIYDPLDIPRGTPLVIPSLKGIREFPNPLA